ncbi:MAG TPA: hypothetical protein VGC95_08845 [Chitinophagaceae bacterium]
MTSSNQTGTKILITVICAAAIAVNKWHPDVFKIDPISAALLVVAILAWFSGIIKAVKLPFIEIELQEAKEKAERALETAQDAKSTAEGAQTRVRIAEKIGDVEAAGEGVEMAAVLAAGSMSEPQQLVEKYKEIRNTYKSGTYRTELMEQLMARMITTAKTEQNFDLNTRLRDTDKGWRLFAYAYSIAHPDFSRSDALAQSAFDYSGLEEEKNQPFGEYWSIRAMQALAAKRGAQAVSSKAKRLLLNHYRQIRTGTDRHFEMKRLLGILEITISQ